MKIIDKFMKYHQTGLIDEVSLVRDILHYMKQEFSESDVFGLGSGLDIVYHADKFNLAFFNQDFIEDLCLTLNLFFLQKRYNGTFQEIWPHVKSLFISGPFGVGPYPVYIRMVSNHQIENKVIIGYDSEFYFAVKNNSADVLKIKIDDNRKDIYFVNSFVFEVPQKLPETQWMVVHSLYKTYHRFISFGSRFGLRGLETFKEKVIKYPETLSRRSLITVIKNSLNRTAAFCFKLYSDFLFKASTYFDKEFNLIGKNFLNISRLIVDESIEFSDVRRPFETMKINDLLEEIAAQLKEAMTNLGRILDSYFYVPKVRQISS